MTDMTDDEDNEVIFNPKLEKEFKQAYDTVITLINVE